MDESTCIECGRVFKDKKGLNIHKKRCSGQADPICIYCNTTFSKSSRVESHYINCIQYHLFKQKEQHDKKIESIQGEHDKKIESIKTEHNKEVESIKREHNKELESIEGDYTIKVYKLESAVSLIKNSLEYSKKDVLLYENSLNELKEEKRHLVDSHKKEILELKKSLEQVNELLEEERQHIRYMIRNM
jgi:hypothetical protein